MSRNWNRRDFIRVASAGVAAIAAGKPAATFAKTGSESQGSAGTISVRLTAGAKRFAQELPLTWQPASATADAIVLNPTKTYQEVLGFGGAFTDAACYVFNQLSHGQRNELFRELFDPSQMNFSVGRLCIGASDYATKAYSYCDGEADPELKNFSIDHDKEYILPSLRAARDLNAGIFLLGSPWSPPGWMKANGSMLGGSFKKKYYRAYANYFLKFLQSYRDAGVPVNAITTQNEVDTDQDGRMPACLWGQEYEIEFVGRHLGPALEAAGTDTKIWLLDHNYSLWGRAVCELEDPKVNRYADGIAWHGYAGSPEAMSRVHAAFPTKHAYWTEGGPDIIDPEYESDWAKWSGKFAGILRNWSRCIIAWNLALDEKGNPNIGPFPCGGVVTINLRTKEITRSGQYWALGHYSRSIRRGARRFESVGDVAEVSHVGFVNPDGGNVVVLTNAGESKTVRLQLENKAAEIKLPKSSVATLTWV